MTVRSWKQVSAPAAPRAQARVRFGSLAVGGGWQLLLIVWTILVVFPFVWMVVSALKTDQEIFFSPWALPATLHLDNFARAWSTAAMGAYFVNSQWNQFILPLVLNPDRERYVLSQGLAFLVIQQGYQNDWSPLFAGLTMSCVPILVVYVVFQRRLESGLTAGALRG